jgi:kumamolisin
MADRKERTPLAGSERAPILGARVIGNADPNQIIDVTIRLHSAAKKKGQGPSLAKPAVHQSRESYEAAFGADQDDIRKVEEFAHENNLTVVEADAGRRTVILRGAVKDFASVFEVELRQYQHADGTYRGRTGAVHIPVDLQDVIEGVFGLDNRPQAKPHFRRLPQPFGMRPHTTPGGTFTPLQLADVYQFPAGDGSGQCIAIIELGGGYRTKDLKTYFKSLGISKSVKVSAVAVGNGHNNPTGDPNGPDGEVMLDIEVAGAIAPAAKIVVYFAENTDAGFLNAITKAVHDKTHKPSVVSISWGGPEASWTTQAMQSFDSAFQAAGAVGVTICAAAGDDGSTDGVGDGHNHVDFPASSPNVLACGGTKLVVQSNKVTETVWNELPNDGATGGGFSSFFPRPDYQKNISGGTRGVPDIAGDADPQTGYQVLVDSQSSIIGGTSAVAPLWAGLIARLNQKLGSPVGFLNPVLYQNPKTCTDVTSGNNGAFKAGTGWDACTGLGSPLGNDIAGALMPHKMKTSA